MRAVPDPDVVRPAILWISPQVRERLGFLAVAVVMIVAGGLVAAVNGVAAFTHGSWLAAYLVLVGGVAQIVLGFGCLALPHAARSPRLRKLQFGLWNGGILTVAGGVVANVYGVVLAGSLVVAAALVGFAAASGPLRESGRNRALAYRALILLLAVSVVVGGVLARTSAGS